MSKPPDWYVTDLISDKCKNTMFIYDPSWFVIENGVLWLWMKKEVEMTDQLRHSALLRMIKKYKEEHIPYYKLCIEAKDVVCYKCGNPVGKNAVSVKSISTTASFRRYYDEECFNKLYH